jgi:hypothetical protein
MALPSAVLHAAPVSACDAPNFNRELGAINLAINMRKSPHGDRPQVISPNPRRVAPEGKRH